MTAKLDIEVVFAGEHAQRLVQLSLPAEATVADAIEASGIAAHFPESDITRLPTGIWGRPVPRSQVLKQGDRVEIYRELQMDPREARRLRALD